MSELTGLKSINVIPDYASFTEGALFVAESIMIDRYNMEKEFAISELADIVNENAAVDKAKKILERVVKFIKDTWEKIKGLWEKFIDTMSKKYAELKSKITKLAKKEDILKAADLLKGSKKAKEEGADGKKIDTLIAKEFGKTYEYKDFAAKVKLEDSKIKNAFSKLPDALGAIKDLTSGNVDSTDPAELKARVNGFVEAAAEGYVKAFDAKDFEEAYAKLTQYIRGSEVVIDLAYIKANASDMYDYVSNFADLRNSVKSALRAERKPFDDALKDIKAIEKVNKDNVDILAIGLSKGVAQIASAISRTSSIFMKEIDIKWRKEASIIGRLALKAATMKKEKEEKKAEETANESAIVPTTIQQEIAALFNF